ncbi:DEAD/DEAH box helicase [Streptomyces halstedii]|uniref:DEAD/DEAH box helicase n=1 Tax=Streptomyces halstedii TaxID=1944 RepID=UPI00346071FC
MAEDWAARLLAAVAHTGLGDLSGSAECDIREALDALLLAAARSGVGRTGGLPTDPPRADEEALAEASLVSEPGTEDSCDDPSVLEPGPQASAPGTSSVWLRDDSSGHSIPGLSLSIGRAPALPNALGIGRALRPLRRFRPSRVHRRLDLGATVDHYTRTGVLVPQLTPAAEPWLEVVVVVDRGTSMAVWEETAFALTKMLRTLSAFRSVHVWHLEHPPQAPPVLHTDHGRLLLMDPSDPRHIQPAHRLLLVLSDCAAPAWRQSDLWQTLHTWGRTASVALINPLPKRLWQRSGLDLPRTTATASVPASPGQLLAYRRPRLFRDDAPGTQPWQALPVLQLDAHQILAWARAMMRTDPSGCEAVLVPATGRVPSRNRRPRPSAVSADTPAVDAQITAAAEAFTDGLRSPAVRLAIAASSLDVFTLPVLDVIRERIVPEAALADAAEFLTAGLLTATRHEDADIVYRFHPAAANHLRGLLSRDQAWDTHFALTDHLAAHPQAPHGIVAALHSPTSEEMLPTGLRPVAQAAAATARLLGIEPTGRRSDDAGQEAGLAAEPSHDDVQQTPVPAAPDDPPEPERDVETPGVPERDGAVVYPYHHQLNMLDALNAEREIHGRHRNLLVAPSGIGKTVMAAFDYKHLCERYQQDLRLLFIADSPESLYPARQAFQDVLMNPDFGEPLHGARLNPQHWNHVFATVQAFGRVMDGLSPGHFDVIVIDEFRGATWSMYRRALKHFVPRELLGLSAAPEREDGLGVQDAFFEGRIAVEMRLQDALEDGLLSPVHYFGIADGIDFQRLDWKGGTYDRASLDALLTADQSRARLVIKAVRDKTADVGGMRAVGFCVSVAHAEFMTQCFRDAGIPAMTFTSSADPATRRKVLASFRSGDLQAIFCVDMLGEGFRIPEADTVLLLRPTSSGTRFLQQLGVGLARAPGKAVLTVLDFIGAHRKEFRLSHQLLTLTNLTGRQLLDRLEHDSPLPLPVGSMITLDETARLLVIDSLRAQIGGSVTDTADGSSQASESQQPFGERPVEPVADLPTDTGPASAPTATSRVRAFDPSPRVVVVRGVHGPGTATCAGIMLTPRLVLTCARPPAEEQLRIVRTDGTEIACRTVWKKTGALDAALVLAGENILDSEDWARLLPSKLKWGRMPVGLASPARITSFERSGYRTELRGQARPEAGMLRIEVTERATADMLTGTSGALVSCDDFFVGMVVLRHLERAELVAVSAASLLQDEGFSQTLAEFMTTPYELEDIGSEPPADSSMRPSEESYEALLQIMGTELTVLRVRAGSPSLRSIQRRAQTLFPDEGVSLPLSTLSSLFNGGYPSRDRLLWLVRTLMSWDRYGQECQPPSNGAHELDPWRDRWEAITQLRPAHQPGSAVLGEAPDTDNTSVPSSVVGQQDVGESHGRPQLARESTPSALRQSMQRSVVFVPDVGTSAEGCQQILERVRSGLAGMRPEIEVRGCSWSREAESKTPPNSTDIPEDAFSLLTLIKRAWRQRGKRSEDLIAPAVGDLLHYRAHGHAIRQLIKETIDDTPGDAVTVIAHSSGGVACFDLLVQEEIGRVDQLITIASQIPFLYETDALVSLQFPQPLPEHFPQRWLNIYDRGDVLSFVAAPVFPNTATDIEVDNRQPFPQTHAAYWLNPDVWKAVDGWLS